MEPTAVLVAQSGAGDILPGGPLFDFFLDKGVLGAINLVQFAMLVVLFRMLIKSYTDRIAEIKETTRVITTLESVLERIELAIARK